MFTCLKFIDYKNAFVLLHLLGCIVFLTAAIEANEGASLVTTNLVSQDRLPSRTFIPYKKRSSEMKSDSNKTDMIVHEREFVSPQVSVQMDCQGDRTMIKFNFTRPFNGIVAAGKIDTTKCKLTGNGTKLYELQVQHNATDCDNQWDDANSSILNTLFIRFHQSLETGQDIAKDIMCRLKTGDLVIGRRPLKSPR